jgi:hypothetical protein
MKFSRSNKVGAEAAENGFEVIEGTKTVADLGGNMLEKVIAHQTYAGYGDWIYGPTDDRPDNTPDDIPTIVEKVRERAPVDAALEKSSGVDVSRRWLEVPTDDLDDDTGPLDTGLMVVKTEPALASALSDWKADFLKRTSFSEPTTTLGKKLGVTRQTIRVVDGERQLRGFNDKGELVDFRILLPETPDTED